MTEGEAPKGVQSMLADPWAMAWMEEHLTDLKLSASGDRILYSSLVISFVLGVAAHVGGYALLSSTPRGALGLLADLLHALGWSLWTGVVVAMFVQVIPEAKRRQISHAIAAYEALRRGKRQPRIDREGAGRQRSDPRRAGRKQQYARQQNRSRKRR